MGMKPDSNFEMVARVGDEVVTVTKDDIVADPDEGDHANYIPEGPSAQ